MHLIKYVTLSGLTSRRKAAHLIKTGLITINHFPITDPNYMVKEKDTVRYKKEVLTPQDYIYIIFNKPAGCVSTSSDPEKRPTIFNYLQQVKIQNLHTIGRLDFNTTGVLIITNDGTLTEKLAHPRHGIKKTYRVTLDRPLVMKDLQKIRQGLMLSDGLVKVDHVSTPSNSSEATALVTIHSGKKHIIKRIFGHLEYHVRELDRVSFAGISHKYVAQGAWRYLKPQELLILKKLSSDEELPEKKK